MKIRESDLDAQFAAFARGAAGDPFDEPEADLEPDTLRARVLRTLDHYLALGDQAEAWQKSASRAREQQKVSLGQTADAGEERNR